MNKSLSIFLVLLLGSALIAGVNLAHFRFLPVRVVLYDTVLDVVIAVVVTAAIYLGLLRRLLPLTTPEFVLTLVVVALSGLLYAISVPTVIDRSLSIYILEKIDQRGGGIREAAFEQVFKDEYMKEHRLVDIRLTEQINSGTIVIRGGCVSLTGRGRRIVGLTRFYRTHLLPKHREIMGEFTDALTDPFRHSQPATHYECKPN